MNLGDKAVKTAEAIRQLKDEWVAEHPDEPDIQIQIYFWRGDELIVVASTVIDKNIALKAGQLGTVGFSATAMALCFEGYHSTLEKSPITGEPWIHQEMQFVCETMPEAQEKGWVTPALTIAAHERGGAYSLRLMPYRVKGDVVEWLEVQESGASTDDEVQADGSMFHYLQHTLQSKTIADHITESGDSINDLIEFMTPEQVLVHSDLATYGALKHQELITSALFPAVEGSLRAQALIQRLGPEAVTLYTPKETDADVD
jgi:hypothetical protein